MNPQRIQLKRAKGWKLQQASADLNGLEAVKVDRTTRWGNPYRPGGNYRSGWGLNGPAYSTVKDSAHAAALYREALDTRHLAQLGLTQSDLDALRGRNLACWCKPGQPCHADALLEHANRPLASV